MKKILEKLYLRTYPVIRNRWKMFLSKLKIFLNWSEEFENEHETEVY